MIALLRSLSKTARTARGQSTMAMVSEHHIRLAQQLHPRLLNFFKKFPPPQIAAVDASAALSQASSIDKPQTVTIAENTTSSDPNIATSTTEFATPSIEENFPIDPLDAASWKRNRNPFLPFKNPRTGNWHGPVYSLRRQADLYKLAAAHNVLSLMPVSPKHPEVREQKRIEHGLQVQGTGVGKRVKGKLWERTLKNRLEERRRAMENMPAMIRDWKERGHGRGWKKWPR